MSETNKAVEAAARAYGTRGEKGSPSEQLHQKRADRKMCFVSGYLAARPVIPEREAEVGHVAVSSWFTDEQAVHVDLIATNPLSADGPTLIRRTTLDDPDIGKQAKEGWATYVAVSEPHTMADCPWPVSSSPDEGDLRLCDTCGYMRESVADHDARMAAPPDESEWGKCVRCGREDTHGEFVELLTGMQTPDNPDGGTGDPICPDCIAAEEAKAASPDEGER